MKTTRIASILAAAALTTTLWASAAMALSFDITGYTAAIDVTNTEGTYASGANASMGDTFTGGSGYFTLHFTGADQFNLKGSLLLQGDAWSSVSSYQSDTFLDTFALDIVNDVLSISSVENGIMTGFYLGSLGNSPDLPGVLNSSALSNTANGQTSMFVNRVNEGVVYDPATGSILGDLQGIQGPTFYSYLLDGSASYYAPATATTPASVALGYGAIDLEGFLAATAYGTFIDMTIDSANVPSSVPEPGTFILFGAGVAGLAFWRRRKA